MALHTTFRTGGEADVYTVPQGRDDLLKILRLCKGETIPFFILAEGQNILVADDGIEGW